MARIFRVDDDLKLEVSGDGGSVHEELSQASAGNELIALELSGFTGRLALQREIDTSEWGPRNNESCDVHRTHEASVSSSSQDQEKLTSSEFLPISDSLKQAALSEKLISEPCYPSWANKTFGALRSRQPMPDLVRQKRASSRREAMQKNQSAGS